MDVLGQDRREGLGRKAESRASIVALGVVSVILLLSSLYSAEASVFRKARESVVDAAAPALAFLSRPIAWIQQRLGAVEDYLRVLEQNQALREENAELRQWMNEAIALRETVSAYERLQSYYAPPDAKPIDAFVIGESNDAFAHSMLVNVGRGEGVGRGQAVVDDKGLVGRIVSAGTKASRVLLLTDVQSRIPVYVEGAGVEGILVGRTRALPAIAFTESTEAPRFAKGQRVLTSGAGGVLPRGIPVGVIAEARGREATVDLYADYARTRIVRVINYEFPQIESDADLLAEEAPSDERPAPAAPVVEAAAAPRTAVPAGTDLLERQSTTSAPATEEEGETEDTAPPPPEPAPESPQLSGVETDAPAEAQQNDTPTEDLPD